MDNGDFIGPPIEQGSKTSDENVRWFPTTKVQEGPKTPKNV